MNIKYLILSLCFMLVMVLIGWALVWMANYRDSFSDAVQAVPVIRFERFDASRKVLIIGLFNPGALSMEIERTELRYQSDSKTPGLTFNIRKYGDKPLVLDPGDTILVPLSTKKLDSTKTDKGFLWGELEFRLPGQPDFYSLHHRFNRHTF